MKQLITLLMFFPLFLPLSAFANNSFLVAPGIVEFDLKKPITQSFIVTNDGDETIRLKITPTYFKIDDRTFSMGKHLSEDTSQIEDLTNSMRVSPKRLSLKPGQRRDIRVSIRPGKDLGDGDYRSHLLVQMLEVARTITNGVAEGGEGMGMNINVKMETAIAIYGSKGQGKPSLEFFCQKNPTNDKFAIQIVNPTVWRFDGQITLTENGKTIFDNRLVSLRGSTKDRLFEHTYNPSADYQVSYNGFKTPDDKTAAACQAL